MGEWSKKIGEFGENSVDEFFKLIGWSDSQKGLDIDCFRSEKHKRKEDSSRRTHGIDRLFSYKSPLIDEQLDVVISSVKTTADKYPSNPVKQFKDYFSDIAGALECFKSSPQRLDINKQYSGITSTKDIGVIFWISYDNEGLDEIIEEVSNITLPTDVNFDTVYVVDNKRMSFVYNSVRFAQRKFPGCRVEFYYHDTGKNYNPLSKTTSGIILPAQFINSSVLLFRIEHLQTKEISLLITTIDKFESDDLKKLIGLAQQITQNWAGKVIIAFPDYRELFSSNEVFQVKQGFPDKNFTDRVSVQTIIEDFRL